MILMELLHEGSYSYIQCNMHSLSLPCAEQLYTLRRACAPYQTTTGSASSHKSKAKQYKRSANIDNLWECADECKRVSAGEDRMDVTTPPAIQCTMQVVKLRRFINQIVNESGGENYTKKR
jgi:hypothetical protein